MIANYDPWVSTESDNDITSAINTVYTIATASSGDNEPLMYICPNDLMILDPNGFGDITIDNIIITENKNIPISLWPELYTEKPHRVPNHYPPAPKKLKFTSNHVEKREINIKQPVSRTGFKRGQRK